MNIFNKGANMKEEQEGKKKKKWRNNKYKSTHQ